MKSMKFCQPPLICLLGIISIKMYLISIRKLFAPYWDIFSLAFIYNDISFSFKDVTSKVSLDQEFHPGTQTLRPSKMGGY